MRDEEKARPVTNSEPVIPLGPSVYTGPAGHAPEADTTVDITTALAGPCVYTQAPSDRSHTAKTKAARARIVSAKTKFDPLPG
jgi:hypothetical protein